MWDARGRIADTITWQNGVEIHETKQYDAHGNMVAEVDGEGRIITKVYGAFGRLLEEVGCDGYVTYFEYDDQGHLIRQYNPGTGKDIRKRWDDAGRLLEVDDVGTGVRTTYSYDIVGNRASEVIATPDGTHDRNVIYQYDAVGQMVRWADSVTGMHTNYQWDAAGNLHRTTTDSGYNPENDHVNLAQMLSEIESELRSIGNTIGEYYSYPYWYPTAGSSGYLSGSYWVVTQDDGEGGTKYYYYPYRTRFISDYPGTQKDVIRKKANELGVGYAHWDEHLLNHPQALQQLLIDMGYGDKLQTPAPDPGFGLVDHLYTYDGNNRVETVTRNGVLDTQFGYDAAGNRSMVNKEGVVTEYEYDAAGRVIRASANGETTADWTYDLVGNVIQFRTYQQGGILIDKVTTKKYYENNRNWFTDENGQTTTLTLDRTGNVTRTLINNSGTTYTYTHNLDAYGRETSIVGKANNAGGTTYNTYDANGNLILSNQGRGDNMDRTEIVRFIYNNDGQIHYRFHDTGTGAGITHTEYAYANGRAVGETGNTDDWEHQTELDTGKYKLIKSIGEDNPTGATTYYTVREGDTLQGIASAVYGNPSLWFLLAEANNIELTEALKEGQQLEVPNNIRSGRLTDETHVLYNESEIIGSTLPNLKSAPVAVAASAGNGGGCGSVLVMIIVVVIAIVVAIVTEGAGSALSEAMISAVSASGATATAITVVSYAVAGALIAAAASIVQQGLFIAMGYQDEFSWGAVGAAAVAGALSGASAGIGKLAELGKFSAETMQYAKIASAALKVSSVASKQLIENGQITSWTSLAAAGVGGYMSVGKAAKIGELARAKEALSEAGTEAAFEAADAAVKEATSALAHINTIKSAVEYVTPWVQMAETYVRNGGEVTATDWANAVGSTIGTAIGANNLGGSEEGNMALRLAANVMVGGALSNVDKEAGQSYLMNAVGNEVGSYIGQKIGQGLNSGLEKLARNMGSSKGVRGAEFDGDMSFLAPEGMPDSYGDWDGGEAAGYATMADAMPDSYGDWGWDADPVDEWGLELLTAPESGSGQNTADSHMDTSDGPYPYQVEIPEYNNLSFKPSAVSPIPNYSTDVNGDESFRVPTIPTLSLGESWRLSSPFKMTGNILSDWYNGFAETANFVLGDYDYISANGGKSYIGLWLDRGKSAFNEALSIFKGPEPKGGPLVPTLAKYNLSRMDEWEINNGGGVWGERSVQRENYFKDPNSVQAGLKLLSGLISGKFAQKFVNRIFGGRVNNVLDSVDNFDGPKTTSKTTPKTKNDSVLNSGGDRLSDSMGPARINNADEYNAIIKDLEDNGVDISYRENALAYGPSSTPGKPGSIVLDPDASISAVRHEYGHFLDDKALGFPPVREYYENPRLRIVSERRQYLKEIETARKIGDNKARRTLIQDYLEEKKYIIDNFYETPYGR